MKDDFENKQEQQEKEGKRNGAILTLVIHGLLLLFFIVTMAWTPPDPPIPQYGIEVNFGFEGTEGSKDIQNKTNPNDSESFEKAKPNPKPEESTDPAPDPTPKPVEADKTPVKDPVKDIEPVTDEADEAVEVPKKKEEKPKESEKPKEEKKKESKADNTGKADEDITNNDGDKKDDSTGDVGKKEGKVDAESLYTGGSGGGATLNLNGWKWDKVPQVKDPSSETGKVVIKFKIDDEGTVISATIAERTVSYTVAEYYRSHVEGKMYFEPTTGGKIPNFTIGSITFVIEEK